MKNSKKFFSFAVIFMVVMAAFCSMSFAADQQYTENLIPVMTSSSSPSGIASCSDYYDSGEAWKAFDGDPKVKYSWQTNGKEPWLAYEFPSPKIISKYTIKGDYEYQYYGPLSWTFEAWDGSKWVVLDTRVNVTTWVNNVKKEFCFDNSVAYIKYRINISKYLEWNRIPKIFIGELEMMGPAVPQISAPTNLTIVSNIAKADLKWDAVEGATSYNIKRAETAGGPYTTIATSSAITYQDTSAKPGITYYYVVTAVNAGGESTASNEVSATITEPAKQMKLVLQVNEKKQLSISDELSDNADMTWSSADALLASVDANGIVKGLKPGNTVITCTSADKSYTESINVLVVNLEYQLAVDLNVGEKCRLTVDDLAGAANATWTSYDPAIAAVTVKGKVTALSEGLTYIVASDKDGKEIGRIYIRIRK